MADSKALTWSDIAEIDSASGRARPADRDAAFRQLVDDYYRRIYLLAYRMVRSEPDAADLTQEAFVRAYRSMDQLRLGVAAGAWLRRIATNLCLDHLRRRTSRPLADSLDSPILLEENEFADREVEDHSGDPDRLFTSAESIRVLHGAIARLPADYREVILLHYMEEMRVDDIAAACGVPSGTIKSRLSRARRELRRKLIPYYGE